MAKDFLTYIKENYSGKSKVETDPGFGLNTYEGNIRFITENGKSNIKRTGVSIWERIDVFYSLLSMSWSVFFLVILSGYIIVNFLFATVYLMIGIESLAGVQATTVSEGFWEAFYFSAQTLTTVGYGRISPIGNASSAVAALESLLGLLGFAVFTGLIYGRFTRPVFALKFSANALIAPYRGITGLLIRVANPKMNELLETEALLMITYIHPETHKRIYVQLELERNNIMFFSMSWTIVHPIGENSPLLGWTMEEIKNTQAEVFVTIKAYDETRSQHIFWRNSYKASEFVYGAKFKPMRFSTNDKGQILYDLGQLSEFDKAELPY